MYCVIDIETTGLNRYKDEINFIGLFIAQDVTTRPKIYILDSTQFDSVKGLLNDLTKVYGKLNFIYQNGKFDTLFIEEKLGIKIPIHHDIMLMGTAFDMVAKHGLKPMAEKYLGVPDWDIKKKDKMSTDRAVVTPYLKKDLKYTWELFLYFMEHMNEQQMRYYKEILRPAYRMYRVVERTGIYYDLKNGKKVKKEYKHEAATRLKGLTTKYPINWNSSKQIQDVLFKKEKMPVITKSKKTGQPSADASTLKKLALQGYPLAKELLDYRKYDTANKMFLNRWEDDASYDGRIHPSFNLTNVRTGRTSCSDPNLQQVPRNPLLRNLFTAPEGRILIEADYSQIELRIAADYANETNMLKVYKKGGDIHMETARTLTGGREPTKEERSKAKAVNFGFIYGMSAKGFINYAFDSYDVIFTLREAQLYREMFFAKYPRLLDWHKEMEYMCEADGGVYNRFGGFQSLPAIYSGDNFERSGAIRKAINSPTQGTASILLMMAGEQIQREHKKRQVDLCGTIHDAVLVEANACDEDWIVPEIKRIMARPKVMDDFNVTFKVPIVADVSVGCWGKK